MARTIVTLLVFALLIVLHGTIEKGSQTLGLSFTFSKMLPYMLQAIVLIVLLVEVYRTFLMQLPLALRRVLGLIVIAGGAGIAFAIHPIYEGDFKHEYRPVYFNGNSAQQLEDGLTMIALPGCSYCYERVEDLNRLVELYPSEEVHIQVVNNDSLALQEYRKRAHDRIQVSLARKETTLTRITGENYPSFVFIQPDTQKGMLWNNNGFGVAAMDFILDQ
ncbi:MAG: hypothetical protein ACQERC_08935 [Bacteroidota bacterium]